MMKKIISLVSVLALAVMMIVPSAALADEKNTTSNYVFDYYDLFTQEEYDALDAQAKAISEEYGVGVYVFVIDDIGDETARDVAKDFYMSDPPLGMGENNDGIMFMVAVDSRDYVTITHGSANDLFNDTEIEVMESDAVDYLAQDEFKEGLTCFVEDAGKVLSGEIDLEGESTADIDTNPFKNGDWVYMLLGSIVAGLIIALVICLIFRSKMKTAKAKTEADDYLDNNTFKLTNQSDTYVTTTITRVPHPKNDNNSSGGGGFGGGSFGGSSGGKF